MNFKAGDWVTCVHTREHYIMQSHVTVGKSYRVKEIYSENTAFFMIDNPDLPSGAAEYWLLVSCFELTGRPANMDKLVSNILKL